MGWKADRAKEYSAANQRYTEARQSIHQNYMADLISNQRRLIEERREIRGRYVQIVAAQRRNEGLGG